MWHLGQALLGVVKDFGSYILEVRLRGLRINMKTGIFLQNTKFFALKIGFFGFLRKPQSQICTPDPGGDKEMSSILADQ
jgi:hypothetical protein